MRLDEPIKDHLNAELLVLRDTQTVEEALAGLRGAKIPQKIVYFYVADDAEKLVGVVPTRRLLMSPLTTKISEVMVPRVHSLPLDATVGDACEMFAMHRLLALPVVDADKKLIGIVDVNLMTDEVFDLSERRLEDEVFQLIGMRAGSRRDPPLLGFGRRFPWLIWNIVGGLVCAFLASFFEGLLEHVVLLAIFLPVVLTLTESVSMQSTTLTIHSLAGGAKWKDLLAGTGRETLTATLLGLACGGIVGGIAYLWKGTKLAAIAITGSITLAMITACLLGLILPATVRAFKADPRLAAGPIVLAAADITCLLIYFTLSAQLLK